MLHEIHIALYLLCIGGILVTKLIVDDYRLIAVGYYAVWTVFHNLAVLELHDIALVEYGPFVGKPRRYSRIAEFML